MSWATIINSVPIATSPSTDVTYYFISNQIIELIPIEHTAVTLLVFSESRSNYSYTNNVLTDILIYSYNTIPVMFPGSPLYESI